MIFQKYRLKINSVTHKFEINIITKFFQKSIRNVLHINNQLLVNNNKSILENKIKFNKTRINVKNLNLLTNLNKKKIV